MCKTCVSIAAKRGLRDEEGARKARAGMGGAGAPLCLASHSRSACPSACRLLPGVEARLCLGWSPGRAQGQLERGERSCVCGERVGKKSWPDPRARRPRRTVRSVLSPSEAAASDFCQPLRAWSGSQPCWHPLGRFPGLRPQRSVPRGGVHSTAHLPPRSSMPTAPSNPHGHLTASHQ